MTEEIQRKLIQLIEEAFKEMVMYYDQMENYEDCQKEFASVICRTEDLVRVKGEKKIGGILSRLENNRRETTEQIMELGIKLGIEAPLKVIHYCDAYLTLFPQDNMLVHIERCFSDDKPKHINVKTVRDVLFNRYQEHRGEIKPPYEVIPPLP